jgi:hypothetical protein
MTAISPKVEVSEGAIVSFCQRWKITEFALFGSILRDGFHPDLLPGFISLLTIIIPFDLLILSLPRRYNNTPHRVGQMGQVEQKCWD